MDVTKQFNTKDFPRKLKMIRQMKNLTQAEMSEELRIGVNSICGWERGHHYPCVELLFQICYTYNINPLWLAGYYDNEGGALYMNLSSAVRK